MTHAWILVGAAALIACSARVGPAEGGAATFVFPARYAPDSGLAEPERAKANEPPTASSSKGPPAPQPPASSLPDPDPLRTASQWVFRLHYDKGAIRVRGAERRQLEEPRVTARRVGRYAIELWIGRELIDRVRFDFPMLAAEPPPRGRRRPLEQPPNLAAGADSTLDVWVPDSPRATRAVLVDRATGQRRRLPWPPDDPLAAPRAAGSGDGGAG